MKKLILVFALFITVTGVFAQNVKSVNGLYYSATGELYTGSYTSHYPDGSKKSEMNIANGKPDGVESTFYASSGKIMETGSYSEGLKAGIWIRYNENGAKTGEASYLNGKKNGTWIVWDDNGKKRYEMNYINGEKAGTWYNWDESGALINSVSYGL